MILPARARRASILLLLLAVLLGWTAPGAAQDAPKSESAPEKPEGEDVLRSRLRTLARGISSQLVAQGTREIHVVPFAFKPLGSGRTSNAGPGLARILEEEFAKLDVAATPQAANRLEGDYHFFLDKAPDPENFDQTLERSGIKLTARVVGALGGLQGEFSGFIQVAPDTLESLIPDVDATAKLAPLPYELPPGGSTQTRMNTLAKAYASTAPLGYIDGSDGCTVKASADSPYSIQVLRAGRPTPARFHDDLPFVDLALGDVYEVRLTNHSSLEAAVKLQIDGLSCFSVSTLRHVAGPQRGEPLYEAWIIPARSSVVVRGWHKSNTQVASFEVGKYEDSVAGFMNQTADVGMIAAFFSAAWPSGADPPSDEASYKGVSIHATREGKLIDSPTESVPRQIGKLRAVVPVRYSLPKQTTP